MPSQKIESGHQDTVHDVQMDYYGKRLATASSDNTIKIIGVSNSTVNLSASCYLKWSSGASVAGGLGSPQEWFPSCFLFLRWEGHNLERR